MIWMQAIQKERERERGKSDRQRGKGGQQKSESAELRVGDKV